MVFLYTEGKFPSEQVDHIDGNGLNNRRDNLREVSHKENMKNRPMQSNNTSGHIGVIWHKAAQKWQAYIKVKGRCEYGGLFTNKKDAITKRKQWKSNMDFILIMVEMADEKLKDQK